MSKEIDIAALRKAAHDCTTTAKLDAMATSARIRLFNKLASAKNILALLDRLEQAAMEAHQLRMAAVEHRDGRLAALERLAQAEKDAEALRRNCTRLQAIVRYYDCDDTEFGCLQAITAAMQGEGA